MISYDLMRRKYPFAGYKSRRSAITEVRRPGSHLTASVIVCAYTLDRWPELQSAVASIREQTIPVYEIILVIDHNQELFDQATKAFPDLMVVENRDERGLSGARNSGIAHSTGQVIAFMDEDAAADPDWIETLLAGYRNPKVVGVGGYVAPAWEIPAPNWLPEEFNWVVGCSYKGLPLTTAVVRNPIGCNMSFRREEIASAGGFRNGIGRVGVVPVGCEETEAAIRIRQHKPDSVYLYNPGAVVHHKVPAWRLTWRYFTRRCYAEGLSKALISRYIGSRDGLSSERSYVATVLSRGVLAGVKQTLSEHSLTGIKRAAAILAGLFLTTVGFVVGRVSQGSERQLTEMTKIEQAIQPDRTADAAEVFKPVKVLEVEISRRLPAVSQSDGTREKIYQKALVLARLHSHPIGQVTIDFSGPEIQPEKLAACLWDGLHEAINQHLMGDELSPADGLSSAGLPISVPARCQLERQELLLDAPEISIILATRDRVQSLGETLNSLQTLIYPHYEIIVVDNASKTNETREYIEQNQPRFTRSRINLRYVREEIPGLAMAHNRGLQEVNTPITAFTDDDVIVDRYWLAEIARGFKAAENVGCVTGLVIPLELETPAQVLFEEFGGFTKGFDPEVYDLNERRPANPLFPYTAGRFGTGANMAFKTDLLKESGGFDPALGVGTPALGADDLAAFFQAIMGGSQLVYQPTALVFHQHRRTFEGLERQMLGYGVGLTAFLTKILIDKPGRIFEIAPKIPAGIRYAFSAESAKNQQKTDAYPPSLERIEREGMLYGPVAYLRSRWKYRKARVVFKNGLKDRDDAYRSNRRSRSLSGS